MSSAHRTKTSMAAIIAVLLIAIIWSLSYWSDASDEAARAAKDDASTTALVASIRQLRPAGHTEPTDTDLGSQVQSHLDDAMKSAEIDAENLDRISPQPARQLEQSELSEIPIQVVFHNLSLRQILLFITSLTHNADWLCLREVHLIHPDGVISSLSGDEWNVEMTISYLTRSTATAGTSASAN